MGLWCLLLCSSCFFFLISFFFVILFLEFLSFAQGVMLTHGNVLATVSSVMLIVPNLGPKDIYLAYLPMAHILELVAEVSASTSTNGLNKYFILKGHFVCVLFSLCSYLTCFDKLNYLF